jgi:hypothetical protein
MDAESFEQLVKECEEEIRENSYWRQTYLIAMRPSGADKEREAAKKMARDRLSKRIAKTLNGLMKFKASTKTNFAEQCTAYLGFGSASSCAAFVSNCSKDMYVSPSGDHKKFLSRIAKIMYALDVEPGDELVSDMRFIHPDFKFPPRAKRKPHIDRKKGETFSDAIIHLPFDHKRRIATEFIGPRVREFINMKAGSLTHFAELCREYIGYENNDLCYQFVRDVTKNFPVDNPETKQGKLALERFARVLYALHFSDGGPIMDEIKRIQPEFQYPPENRNRPEIARPEKTSRTRRLSPTAIVKSMPLDQKLAEFEEQDREFVNTLVSRVFGADSPEELRAQPTHAYSIVERVVNKLYLNHYFKRDNKSS